MRLSKVERHFFHRGQAKVRQAPTVRRSTSVGIRGTPPARIPSASFSNILHAEDRAAATFEVLNSIVGWNKRSTSA
jgi:hypothetical protein